MGESCGTTITGSRVLLVSVVVSTTFPGGLDKPSRTALVYFDLEGHVAQSNLSFTRLANPALVPRS